MGLGQLVDGGQEQRLARVGDGRLDGGGTQRPVSPLTVGFADLTIRACGVDGHVAIAETEIVPSTPVQVGDLVGGQPEALGRLGAPAVAASGVELAQAIAGESHDGALDARGLLAAIDEKVDVRERRVVNAQQHGAGDPEAPDGNAGGRDQQRDQRGHVLLERIGRTSENPGQARLGEVVAADRVTRDEREPKALHAVHPDVAWMLPLEEFERPHHVLDVVVGHLAAVADIASGPPSALGRRVLEIGGVAVRGMQVPDQTEEEALGRLDEVAILRGASGTRAHARAPDARMRAEAHHLIRGRSAARESRRDRAPPPTPGALLPGRRAGRSGPRGQRSEFPSRGRPRCRHRPDRATPGGRSDAASTRP